MGAYPRAVMSGDLEAASSQGPEGSGCSWLYCATPPPAEGQFWEWIGKKGSPGVSSLRSPSRGIPSHPSGATWSWPLSEASDYHNLSPSEPVALLLSTCLQSGWFSRYVRMYQDRSSESLIITLLHWQDFPSCTVSGPGAPRCCH